MIAIKGGDGEKKLARNIPLSSTPAPASLASSSFTESRQILFPLPRYLFRRC